MKTAIVAAWLITMSAVTLLSLAPISLDGYPGDADWWFAAGHALAYAVLMLLTTGLLRQIWRSLAFRQAVFVAATATILFGGFIELVQPYVGRQRDFTDFIINTLGVTAALVFLLLARRKGALQHFAS